MRLRIRHETLYHLGAPAMRSVQYLRLTPRSDICQRLIDWRVSGPEHLSAWEDGLSNQCHIASDTGQIETVRVVVQGDVETIDTNGVLPLDDGLPPGMFLRLTPRTTPSSDLAKFARRHSKALQYDGDVTGLHSLMNAIAEEIPYEAGDSTVDSTAAEVFKRGRAVCQDHAHLFITCCRHLNIPARYVSGYIANGVGDTASHAWAEAFVTGLGWVSFDPSNCQSATQDYVRLAVGFDYGSAAPIIGLRAGGDDESMSVDVQVEQVQN